MSREELERRKKKTFTYYQITNFICFWVSSKSNWLCESWSCILGSDTYHLTHDFSSSSLQNYCEQEDWKIFFFFFFPDHQRDCCFKTQWAFIAFVFYFLETLPKFWQMQIVMVSDICLAHYPRGPLKCCEIFSWRSFCSFSFIPWEVQREGKEI